jgi:hypothetical protein
MVEGSYLRRAATPLANGDCNATALRDVKKRAQISRFFACVTAADSAKTLWFGLVVMGGIKIVIDDATQL